jgi:hypothetical protein
MAKKVDGEDFQQAETVKHKHLSGPSEEELSKEREAKVAYVPPPLLVAADAPKSKSGK